MLTDKDIIKAMSYCCIGKINCDERCPMYKNKTFGITNCRWKLINKALDLINHQKEEIEKLKIDLDAMRGAANSYKMHYEKAKAEIEALKLINSTYDVQTAQIRETAIKEFALSLINKSNDEKISRTDIVDFIVEFLKEEKGE